MFRELLGGEKSRKSALRARGPLKDLFRDYVGFECLERTGPFGNLFEDFTGLCVGKVVRKVWLMHERIERDFWWFGHWPVSALVDVHKACLILFMLRIVGSQTGRFLEHTGYGEGSEFQHAHFGRRISKPCGQLEPRYRIITRVRQ
jgi:hypothetical protein